MIQEIEMYRAPGALWLVQKGKDRYRLYSKDIYWEGTLREMWRKMHFDFGVTSRDIRIAIQEMEFKDHLASHFGAYGGFIFTQEDFPVQ